jgi:signal transduction histidine kinase
MRSLLRACNVIGHCRELEVGLWSCPQFLFLVMGGIIITAILSSYTVAARYTAPEVAIVIVIVLSVVLLIIAYVIERAFERTVEAGRRERAHAADLLALKDQFVFVAAHELRAPVTAIKWALEVLQKKNPQAFSVSPESLEALSINSNRLLNLVEDLLQVSRLESGVVKITREPIELRSVADASLAAFAGEAEKRGIALCSSIPRDVRVVADPVRLREVFDNLVGNAIKFNKVGGTVTLAASVDDEHTVSFSVADTGLGLSKEDTSHVFEKFWRSSGVNRIEGTGLGLFIVQQLVVRMDGEISFTSALGKGTTFHIRLPKDVMPEPKAGSVTLAAAT